MNLAVQRTRHFCRFLSKITRRENKILAVILKLSIFILKLSMSNCSYHHQYNTFWANQDYQILFQQNIENKEIINY